MTRFFAVLLTLFVMLPSPARAALRIVTTTQDLASLAESVGGDLAQVDFIARGDLDPHFIDAKPSYMLKLANADLVICAGLELEIGWLPALLAGARNPKVQPGAAGYLDASTSVTPIEIPSGSIDRSRGDLHALGNPHWWLDPENGRRAARAIAARLGQLDPGHATQFSANLAAFEKRLDDKQVTWARRLEPLRGTAVIGYHATYDYFFARYGLRVIGFIEPTPGIPPTPRHTLDLATLGQQQGARFVVVEPFHDVASARTVSDRCGAVVVRVPSSVGADDRVPDYFALFDVLVSAIAGG